jgi:hypothetical protein
MPPRWHRFTLLYFCPLWYCRVRSPVCCLPLACVLQVYKQVLQKPIKEDRVAGICQRENAFYVDTVRAFRWGCWQPVCWVQSRRRMSHALTLETVSGRQFIIIQCVRSRVPCALVPCACVGRVGTRLHTLIAGQAAPAFLGSCNGVRPVTAPLLVFIPVAAWKGCAAGAGNLPTTCSNAAGECNMNVC